MGHMHLVFKIALFHPWSCSYKAVAKVLCGKHGVVFAGSRCRFITLKTRCFFMNFPFSTGEIFYSCFITTPRKRTLVLANNFINEAVFYLNEKITFKTLAIGGFFLFVLGSMVATRKTSRRLAL